MATKKKNSALDSTGGISADLKKDLTKFESLFELMGKHQIAEVEWEKGGERLFLRAKGGGTEGVIYETASVRPHANVSTNPAAQAPSTATGAAHVGPDKPKVTPHNHKQVVSPFVGTFYRSPNPNAEQYVREGQNVKRGDTLCIIEAMKLMNEIEAEFPGKIISVLVENGQPVEFGEPLFLIEAS
ncbi:MAG: acetyl-CoA carboxylase biotin carboxyl carrier protein [Bdellovibrionota bacterium]